MIRYFLHLYNSVGYVPDSDGHEFPNLEAARAAAIQSIRDMVSADAKAGDEMTNVQWNHVR